MGAQTPGSTVLSVVLLEELSFALLFSFHSKLYPLLSLPFSEVSNEQLLPFAVPSAVAMDPLLLALFSFSH